MRIALDARTVYRPIRHGTGKNLIDLYTHLAALRPDWRVVAYHRETGEADALLPAPMVEPRRIEMIGDRFDAWDRWRLPLAAWRDGATLLHCPANICPTWVPVNTVVTIHDLIPLDLPRGRQPSQIRRFEQSVRFAAQRAAWIICPSRYTRDRLVSEFGADGDRVTVNAWAADSAMHYVEPGQSALIAARYDVDRPYVLHFGARNPRKNTARVLSAWSQLDAALRRDWRLLVVGLDDRMLASMRTHAAELGVDDSVRLHPFADEADLPALLSGAQVLCYPSLSEGFGLPILDAWTTGTAVLTSNATSLPEVAEDGAVLIDPTDTAAIVAGLTQLMQSEDLRHHLHARGRMLLGKYTWRNTADRFAQAMEAAAGLTSPRSLAA